MDPERGWGRGGGAGTNPLLMKAILLVFCFGLASLISPMDAAPQVVVDGNTSDRDKVRIPRPD